MTHPAPPHHRVACAWPTALAMAAALALSGCSSRQMYGAGQSWQRNECFKIHDVQDRSRCLSSSSMPLQAYEREAEAARHGEQPPSAVGSGGAAHPSDIPGPAGREAPAANPDHWPGRWRGPEGTFLLIAPVSALGDYALTIQNLDGPTRYTGRRAGDTIAFTRQGSPATIRATDGPGTGMKWLQDKRHCLVIQPGEGYCRD